MTNINFLEYAKLKQLNVSRETFVDLEEYRSLILEKNEKINLISTKSALYSRERHIIDSAQIIDFIDKNHHNCSDIGSGSGLPGVVLAIIMKHRKSNMKFQLYEKSYHKSSFLKEVSKKFELNIDVIQKDIFEQKNIASDLVVARAFKPLPVVLDLVNSNFKKFKNIIFFLGKNGRRVVKETLNVWQFEYEEKKSITSEDSFIINIKSLKKK